MQIRGKGKARLGARSGSHRAIVDEWVVVTGAGGLIGRAIVDRVVAVGGRVVAVDQSSNRLEELKSRHRNDGLHFMQSDVTSQSDLDEVVGRVSEMGSRLIVHAAGWQVPDGRSRVPGEDEWASMFAVHVTAPSLLTARLFQAAHERGATGSAVFMSSVHEDMIFGDPSYAAAKGAVHNAVKELAGSAADRGSRVNSIAPGHVDTNPIESPPTRLGKRAIPPESISSAAVFLLCDDCSPHTTGATLLVDAGMRLNDPWAPPPTKKRWR